MDLLGVALMIGLLTSYILALQYAGQTHPWDSSEVIGLLVGCVLMLAAFIAWQLYQGEYAMIVPCIVGRLRGSQPSFEAATLTIMLVQ